MKSQKALQELQPKLDALKVQYKDNKEQLAQEMMKLYKEQKVNPMSSCLPILIQLPIIIALYQVLRSGLNAEHFEFLYAFVVSPGEFNTLFLGFMDLTAVQPILAVLAAGAQFLQTRMLTRKQPPAAVKGEKDADDESMMAMVNKNMSYTMPLVTLVIGLSLSGGLTLYWLTTTVVTVVQQWFVYRQPSENAPIAVEVEEVPAKNKKLTD
jgi:YidC/Oxa1 family membrane protein insertase